MITFIRRSRAALSLILVLAATALSMPVLAAAPMAHKQAPGYYRMMLGEFEITALSDGTHAFPVHEVLTYSAGPQNTRPLDAAHPGQIDTALAGTHLGLPLQGSINAFLVNTGASLVLIDTGAGALYGKDGGHLLDNLRASGYSPEQIDVVLITHLHADHIGGVMVDGKAAFPNAVIRVSQADADYWLSDKQRATAPAFLHGMFDGAQKVLAPYLAAGKVQAFTADGMLLPGIRAIAAPGHTPGHSNFFVESKGQGLLVWGDTVHVAPVQFAEPAVTVKYDSDAWRASQQREALFADAAQRGYWIAAAHISFPGLGHISARSGQYEWQPANYSADPEQK